MDPMHLVGGSKPQLSVVGGATRRSDPQLAVSDLVATVQAMRERIASQALDVGLRVDPSSKRIIVEVTELSSGAPIVEFPLTDIPKRMPSLMSDPYLIRAKA